MESEKNNSKRDGSDWIAPYFSIDVIDSLPGEFKNRRCDQIVGDKNQHNDVHFQINLCTVASYYSKEIKESCLFQLNWRQKVILGLKKPVNINQSVAANQ